MQKVHVIYFVSVLCIFCLVAVGCAGKSEGGSSVSAEIGQSSVTDSKESTDVGDNILEPYIMINGEQLMQLYPESMSDTFQAKEFFLPLEEGCEIGSITAGENSIFYEIQQGVDEGQYDTHSWIYRLDTETGGTEFVLEIENDGGTFYINELNCVGDDLFWYYEDANESKVERYSLETRVRDVLVQSDAAYPYVLCGDDRFLTWYEAKDGEISLFTYDTEQNELFCIARGITADSPFTRAYVIDGKTFYLESTSTGRRLVIYDLIDKAVCYTCVLPTSFEATRLQTNGEYVICTERYDSESPLFLLNREKKTFDKMEIDLGAGYIFACHLFKDYVVINSNGSDETVIVSLADKRYIKLPVSTHLVQSNISPEGMYYACTCYHTEGRDTPVGVIYALMLNDT